MTYRATEQASTGYSPAELFLGRKLYLSHSLYYPEIRPVVYSDYVNKKLQQFSEVQDLARRTILRSWKSMQRCRKQNRKLRNLVVGDQVLLYNPVVQPHKNTRFIIRGLDCTKLLNVEIHCYLN